MTDLNNLILTHSTIGIAKTCELKRWSALWLRISNLFHIEYSGKPCSLPFLNCVGSTLELTTLKVLQHMGKSCWGSYCRCSSCTHGIWGSYWTPSTPAGRWTYLLPFLSPLKPHSYTLPGFPSWYYMSKTIFETKAVSDPTSEKHLHHEILLLRPWTPLATVPLGLHNPLPQTPMHITRGILLPYSCFRHIEI